jgi:hypothetical protein
VLSSAKSKVEYRNKLQVSTVKMEAANPSEILELERVRKTPVVACLI